MRMISKDTRSICQAIFLTGGALALGLACGQAGRVFAGIALLGL